MPLIDDAHAEAMALHTEGETGMSQGTVKRFNADKGFGIITQEGVGQDVFGQFSVIQATGFRTLDENQMVEFVVRQGPRVPRPRTPGRTEARPKDRE
jgi:CspA family cold shock protein